MKMRKKALILIILSPVILLLLVAGYVAVSYAWAKTHQISAAQANKKCQDFYNDVQSQVSSAQGYTIVHGTKRCRPVKDESGFTDYTLEVAFRMTAPQSNADKAALDTLTHALPHKNYPVTVQNMYDGQHVCVSAERYINDNGSDVPQGETNGPHTSYVDLNTVTNPRTPCEAQYVTF